MNEAGPDEAEVEQARADDLLRLNQVADLSLRIGDVLMSSGAGAADITVTMQAVVGAYGERNAEIDVTFTTLSVGLARQDEDLPSVLLIRGVKRRALDYDVLTSVDQLVAEIVEGKCDLPAARRRMNQIVGAPRLLPRWAVTLAWGVMAAAVAVYLGSGPLVSAVAFVAAVLIERAQAALARQRLPYFYQQVAGGAIATLLAVGLEGLVSVQASMVVTANIVILLAGIGFMGALQDGLSGFYLTGCARLLEALLATAGIIAGVALGLNIGRAFDVNLGALVPGQTGWVSVPITIVGGAVSASAFAAACRAPLRSWLPIGVAAGLASIVYALVQAGLESRPWSSAAGAFFVGLIAYALAGRLRIPPLVVAVSSVVPFLPGLSIYRGLSLLSAGGTNLTTGLLAMMTAVSTALALASGVIFGEYVAQPVRREARRLEDRLAGPRLVGTARPNTRRGRRQAEADAASGH